MDPTLPKASNWDEYALELRKVLLALGLMSFKFSNEIGAQTEPDVEPL